MAGLKSGPQVARIFQANEGEVVSNSRKKNPTNLGPTFLVMDDLNDGLNTTKSGQGRRHPPPNEARKHFGTRKWTKDKGGPTQLH